LVKKAARPTLSKRRCLDREYPQYLLGVLFICFVGAPLNLATAQSNEQIVNVRNAGSFTCEEVLPALTSPGREIEKTAFLQWTAAYATAASRSNGLIDVFPLASTSELVLMTSLVCRENLTVSYETALRATIGRLRDYWIRQSPEFITLNDPGGRTVLFYAEAIPQLQRDLQNIGTRISVDGAYGNQTGNAIRELNEARGLPLWLTPDGTLFYMLTVP
jgi:hypothetical protein